MYYHYVLSLKASITHLRFILGACIEFRMLQEAYFVKHKDHYHVVVKFHPASHFRLNFGDWLITDCGVLNCSKDEWFGYLSDNGRYFIHTVSVSAL